MFLCSLPTHSTPHVVVYFVLRSSGQYCIICLLYTSKTTTALAGIEEAEYVAPKDFALSIIGIAASKPTLRREERIPDDTTITSPFTKDDF